MTGHGVENLRLEVEVPIAGLPNLIPNPSGDGGSAYGWTTPVGNTTLDATPGTPGHLEFATVTTQAARVTSEFLPVTAGTFVAAQLTPLAFTTGHNIKARFEWYDAAKALLSSSTQTAAISATGTPAYVSAVAAPANTVFVKLRLDFYNGTGNPSAGASFQWRHAMVTWADTSGGIQTTRTNLHKNPSLETNNSGWSADTSVTSIARVGNNARVGTYAMRLVTYDLFTGNVPVLNGSKTNANLRAAVTGGKTYTASVYSKAATVPRNILVGIVWYDAGGWAVGGSYASVGTPNGVGTYTRHHHTATAPSDAVTAIASYTVLSPNTSETHYFDTALFEAGATLGAYFDGSTVAADATYAWAGTAHASTSTEARAQYDFAEPNDWRNILGPTHEISVGRAGLDVGLLSATVLDPLLDPVVESQMRPGKKIRAQGLTAGEWRDLYVGKITAASVTYVPETRVNVTASDAIADLAAQAERRSVATLFDLSFLLEGKGVPWIINGSGGQPIGGATIVGDNENASMLDQIAITRDTTRGHAYVSRSGVLEAFDLAPVAPPTLTGALTDDPAALTTTRRSYVGLDLAFGTDECINSVTIKYLRYKASKKETTEIVYGPYRDEASIAAWGVHSAEFPMVGTTENTTAIEAHAAAILAANATPTIAPRTVTFNVEGPGDLALALEAELGHLINVTHEGVTYTPRITAIDHAITPDKWLVTLTFAEPGSVAAPTITPSPPPPASGSNAPQAGEVTVNINSVNNDFSRAVTFPNGPFLTTPIVVLCQAGANPARANVSVSNVTKDGFTAWVNRNTGTTNTTCYWIAYASD